MTILALDHVNIRSKDPAATTAFFVQVLGMGQSPVRDSWITDDAGRAVIHIGAVDALYPSDAWRPFHGADDSGAIHHVALSCSNYDATRQRLLDHGCTITENDVPRMNFRQIFVAEPGGVLLEPNFAGD